MMKRGTIEIWLLVLWVGALPTPGMPAASMPLAERTAGALWGLFAGDALAMPVHWYYGGPDQIREDFGGQLLSGFERSVHPYPDSIMQLSNTGGGGRGSSEGDVVGGVILHGKKEYWRRYGQFHYHHTLEAGENTLEASLVRVLLQSLKSTGRFSADDFRRRYIEFMTTPGTHNDTYASTCHRMFFQKWRAGVDPKDCPDNDGHNVDTIDGLVIPSVVALISLAQGHSVTTAAALAVEALAVTRSSQVLPEYIRTVTYMLDKVLQGSPLDKAAAETAMEVYGSDLAAAVRKRGSTDPVVACYIGGSFPALLHFAYKYTGSAWDALLASANAGGENVHRTGSAVGCRARAEGLDRQGGGSEASCGADGGDRGHRESGSAEDELVRPLKERHNRKGKNHEEGAGLCWLAGEQVAGNCEPLPFIFSRYLSVSPVERPGDCIVVRVHEIMFPHATATLANLTGGWELQKGQLLTKVNCQLPRSLTVDSNQFRGTVKATDLGGFCDTTATPAASARAGSGISKEELAQREARDRHLADISEEAEEAVQQRELWQNHLRRCMEEEKKDMDWRSAIERDYREMLKDQIREVRQRRQEAKRESVEQASMHGFPDFSKPSSISVKDYIVERRLHLKEDLDLQVELKKRQKEHRKAIEHEMDHINNLAAHKELAQQKVKDRERGRQVLQECLQNWEDTKRIKDARAAITHFKKSPAASGTGLADIVTHLRSETGSLSAREKTPSNPTALPKSHCERPQKVNIAAELPATPSEDALSMPLSSRPTTGSVRRFPISAAANLALTKQRLKERGMM
ncbi:unnamed protein product [Symbiodinium natans]|uniref:Uncharacterized protein n=1 Tax=Symbiodinium natans TaxID=878477 RepID=A0A812IBM4_9DINO|nr:unnamed protein product [Symbiodinium natans]